MRSWPLATATLIASMLVLVASLVAANRALGVESAPASTAASATPVAHVHEHAASPTTATPSYAGVTGADAKAAALAHEPYPAALPPVPPATS